MSEIARTPFAMFDPANPQFSLELVTCEDGVKRLKLTPRKRTPYDYLSMEEQEERRYQEELRAGKTPEEPAVPAEPEITPKKPSKSPRPEPKAGELPYGFYGEKYKKKVKR